MRAYLAGASPAAAPASPQNKARLPLIVGLVVVVLGLVIGGGVALALRSGSSQQASSNNQPVVNTAPTFTATTAITPTPTLPPSPTPVVLTPATGTALIQQFYVYINARNFDAAYDLLSTAFQQKQSRQNFTDGYQTTVQDVLTVQSAETLSDGTVEVDVNLLATDNKNGTQVQRLYTGYYIVILENGALRILRGNLK
jgi:hypothetical protein